MSDEAEWHATVRALRAELAEARAAHAETRRQHMAWYESQHALCKPGERKVLDEMAALPDSLLEGLKTWPHVAGPFVAELARRKEAT